MRDTDKIIDIPIANLTPVFSHEFSPFRCPSYIKQSCRQQHAGWLQAWLAVPKQSKLPSLRWIAFIKSFFGNFQVSFIPSALAFFSISSNLMKPPPLRLNM